MDKKKKKRKNKIKRQYKLEIGQTVRLSHVRGLFDREYSQNGPAKYIKSRRISKERAYPCTGSIEEKVEGKFYEQELQSLRQYARQLQRLGYPLSLKKIKMVTASASHSLSDRFDIMTLAIERTVVYEPELFPALNFKMDGINFCCFHMGKVVITGEKCISHIDDVVLPTLIELELYTRKSSNTSQQT